MDLNLNYRKLRIYRIQETKNENSMMTHKRKVINGTLEYNKGEG